jgi:uncharacterized membrane protein YczE
MLGGEVLLALAVVVFAAIFRFKGKFRRTSMVLTVLIAILAGWFVTLSVPLASPAIVALVAALLFMYVPRFGKK